MRRKRRALRGILSVRGVRGVLVGLRRVYQPHHLKAGLVHDLVMTFKSHLIAQVRGHERGRTNHVAQHGRLHRKIGGHRAQAQRAVGDLRSAKSQRDCRGDTHNQGLVQRHAGHEHRSAVLALLQSIHGLGVAANLLGGASQRLNHADAAHRLFDAGRKVTGQLLNLMGDPVVLAREVHQRQHQHRHRHHEDQRQQGR